MPYKKAYTDSEWGDLLVYCDTGTKLMLISSYSLSNLSNARREIAVGNVSGYAGKMQNIISIFVGSVESDLLNLMGR